MNRPPPPSTVRSPNTAAHSSTATRRAWRALLAEGYLAPGDPSLRFVTEHFARAGAETGIDRALRLDTMVMLVDDPVKRVDNMTMAWGLEGRVPFLDHELVELAATCPPELKVAHGGKGVLKEAARRVIPSEVIDRPKGYFPVPALTHLEGPYLDMVRDALYAPVAKERGLFDTGAVDALLADPNGRLTPLRGNELVADRAARALATTSWCDRAGRMTAIGPSKDHTEAITLGLHDASPPDLVDAMAKDVELELGWGELIFGQTFADAGTLAEALRREAPGRRDICIYAREPQIVVAGAPSELFIDPSHTYRLRFTDDSDEDQTAASPMGVTVRPLERLVRRRRDEPRLRPLRDGSLAGRDDLEQQPAPARCHLSARGTRGRRRRSRHGDRRRPRAAVQRPRAGLESVDVGGRSRLRGYPASASR